MSTTIVTNRQLLSKPVITREGLSILLHGPFGRTCQHSHFIGPVNPVEFEEAVWANMEVGGPLPNRFLELHGQTVFLKRIYYQGGELALGLDFERVYDYEEPFVYHAPNDPDRDEVLVMRAQIWLMGAFEAWVKAASRFLQIPQ